MANRPTLPHGLRFLYYTLRLSLNEHGQASVLIAVTQRNPSMTVGKPALWTSLRDVPLTWAYPLGRSLEVNLIQGLRGNGWEGALVSKAKWSPAHLPEPCPLGYIKALLLPGGTRNSSVCCKKLTKGNLPMVPLARSIPFLLILLGEFNDKFDLGGHMCINVWLSLRSAVEISLPSMSAFPGFHGSLEGNLCSMPS